jgi:uncharacterized membrane protein (DUF2068 family)
MGASEPAGQTADQEIAHDRFLPWIAAERAFRALVLLAVGIVLVTHPHANWGEEVTRLAEKLGQNPRGNWIKRIIDRINRLHADKNTIFGIAALGYAVLEGVEAYGLWTRKRWGEWLTVLATSLFFIPEVWELTKSASVLKVGALLANVVIVAYLLRRLRRSHARMAPAAGQSSPAEVAPLEADHRDGGQHQAEDPQDDQA